MSGGGDTQTVQRADPWREQQPYLIDIFERAQGLYNTQDPTFFPGNTVAGFTPNQVQGQNLMTDAATGGQQNLAQGVAGANQFLLGDVMDMSSNPYMAQAMSAAIDPIYQNLERRALPAVRSGAVAAGQLGGSRQGIAEGLAISDANRQAMNTTAVMANDQYGRNLEAMQRGLALAPQSQAAQLAPGQTLNAVGAEQQAYEQALINEAIARHDFEQRVPWDQLGAYNALVQGNFGGTQTTTSPGPSTGARIAGAGAAGIGAYGALAATPLAPVAAPIAGALALASLFG